MNRKTAIKAPPPASPLAVEWHDCEWIPAIIVRPPSARRRPSKSLPATPPVSHNERGRHGSTSFKIMKSLSFFARRPRAGFTLIELLVVIAIIGILAAMLLAVLPGVTRAGKNAKAHLEAQAIATAIQQYDSAYGRFPVSSGTQTAAGTGDFTYGGSVISNSISAGQLPNTYSVYTANNSEVIAILMNITNYPSAFTTPPYAPTANTNYVKNPQKTIFLTAKMSGWEPAMGGTPQPGVGNDLVYRDPWGNPYIISMDLNYDDVCNDAIYSRQAVSQTAHNSQTGYNGLFNPNSNPNTDNFQYHGKVMVWSAGSDGKIDPGDPVTDAENKNNILSWQ